MNVGLMVFFSRDNLSRVKDGAYLILGDKKVKEHIVFFNWLA